MDARESRIKDRMSLPIVSRIMDQSKQSGFIWLSYSFERIGSKITTPRRIMLKHAGGIGVMALHLVGSLLRHRLKWSHFLAHKESFSRATYWLQFVSKKISQATPLWVLRVRLILAKTQSTRGTTMREPAVTVYLTSISQLYQGSSKEKKGLLLDDAEKITERSRKQLIKRLSEITKAGGATPLKRSGRPPVYSKKELQKHIKYLWEQMEKISPDRMKAALPDWLHKYEQCPAHLKFQLSQMSASTLKRYLKEIRLDLTISNGLPTTSPARYMKNKVPINTLDSKVLRPGHLQADTVSHCGDNAKGPFISSLTATDIKTTWTECRAMFTKRGIEVRKQTLDIKKSLPFKIFAMNTDSGSEFLNNEVYHWMFHSDIHFTRSRPYKKNDNCYVEQKNFTHVRELFGYERFDDPALVSVMNNIYKNYWNPLQNFFLPSFKLKEKIRVGAKVKKKYETPKTPYQRVIESGVLSQEEVEILKKRKAELNPFELKAGLELSLKEFFEIVRKITIREVA